MEFKFRRQRLPVSRLILAVQRVLPEVSEANRAALTEALRGFEDAAAVLMVGEQDLGQYGKDLAAAERRSVMDRFAEMYTLQKEDQLALQQLCVAVVDRRPTPGNAEVIQGDELGGHGWVSVLAQSGGGYEVRVWDGLSPKGEVYQRDSYPAARDFADECIAAVVKARQSALGSQGEVAWIMVPKPGSAADSAIDPRSGVVGQQIGDHVRVYYEGNRMGAENLRTYSERVKCAAGRLFKRYPTVAVSSYAAEAAMDQFDVVGLCTDDYRLMIQDPARVLAYAGKPGLMLHCVDGGSFVMNEKGHWTRDGADVSRDVVANSQLFDSHESMEAI